MEIYSIPIDSSDSTGKYIIYRPLAGLAFIGNRAMVDLTRALVNGNDADYSSDHKDAYEFLASIGFLESDPTFYDLVESSRVDYHPTMAVLLLTNQCHLRCTYCYADGGAKQKQEMPYEIGCAAIDYVFNNAQASGQNEIEVSFHGGGEPTFNWKKLRSFTDYVRQKPIESKVTLTSNGIWSHSQCEWIVNNLNGVSLSMDGAPSTQDRQRPFASGEGSSAIVLRNMAMMERMGYDFGIRMTATAPWQSLPEDVRFICENTGCQTIQVEPAFNIQRGYHDQPDTVGGEAFVSAFLRAYEIASNAGRHLYYSGGRLGIITTTFCSAPYGALIVRPDGGLVTCYEIADHNHTLAAISEIGQIEPGGIFVDQPSRDRLLRMMAERRDTCRECFCYWGCAGDCYSRAFHDGKNGHLVHGPRCEVNRGITKGLLLRGIAEGDGVWRAQSRMMTPRTIEPPIEAAENV